ncbi:MAG: hypothetical protein HYZ42_06360, partial [Bacteroidetes bacterium]|nr:hypothetical protein [Bacteroidota bacterium]
MFQIGEGGYTFIIRNANTEGRTLLKNVKQNHKMISYYLSENRLATTPGQHIATVSNAGSIGEDELIDLITADGSGVSKAATKAVLERLVPAMLTMLKTGNTVNLG